MSFYFVCPGDATVSNTQVQCSTAIQTVDADDPLINKEDLPGLFHDVLTGIAILLACWLIKKAIDI